MRSSDILKRYFRRKQEFNSSYSLRAFARDLGVSPSYVSAVLSGGKRPSIRMIERAIRVLELDESAEMALKRAVAAETAHGQLLLENAPQRVVEDAVERFRPLPKGKQSLLHRWYYVAVLDLITCSDFQSEPSWIARRLGISVDQVRESLFALERLGLIQLEGATWTKVAARVRVATQQSQKEVRDFHRQMIEKSLQELTGNTDQDAFDKRLIAGVTFAANPAELKKARQMLNEAVHQVATELMRGECTEVYQINLQLFPLTK